VPGTWVDVEIPLRRSPALLHVSVEGASCSVALSQLTFTRGMSRKPNVLLISIDTLRMDRMSGYGYPRPTTTEIDGPRNGRYGSPGRLLRLLGRYPPTRRCSRVSGPGSAVSIGMTPPSAFRKASRPGKPGADSSILCSVSTEASRSTGSGVGQTRIRNSMRISAARWRSWLVRLQGRFSLLSYLRAALAEPLAC
jgi:hypothetical protein